jgi:predicted alpha/beta superfamily hydrolase
MRIGILVAAAIVLAAIGSSLLLAADAVTVRFIVTPPAGTDAQAQLYLAGSLEAVGNWKADGRPLVRQPDGSYLLELSVGASQRLEYKITRGSWQTVEKGPAGEELANRVLEPKADSTQRVTVARWADATGATPPTTRQSTVRGDVRVHEMFHSTVLSNDRKLLVYLPPGYDKAADRYPVLYMHDGQNLFDAATSFAGEWNADETADALIKTGTVKPVIIVGIENRGAERMDEYTPTRDADHGGKAHLYARFVVEEVKPFIDSTYRTLRDRRNTAVGGSSLGGLVSLYLCQKYSDSIGACAAISPALGWDDGQFLRELIARPDMLKDVRLWLDMGTQEGSNPVLSVQRCEELAGALRREGWVDGKDLIWRKVVGAGHNEAAWSERFGEVLVFLFGSDSR